MTFREWEEKYKPISIMPHALFGDDYEELKDPRRREQNLWTVIEGDDSGLYITNGFHFVNRVGYILTEVDFGEPKDIEVCWIEPDEATMDDAETEEIVVGV